MNGKSENAMVWTPDQGGGTYKNPIIHADYSDPDVIRTGEDFFMVASSFNCMPGIPVLHSKDLVNWKIVNHVFDRLPFTDYDIPAHRKGAWAPSIRYHAGRYYVFFSTPDEGIFMSTAEDPFGKWAPIVHVKKAKGWIDPCPFWDDDGNAYLVHAFAKSRTGFNSILNLCRMQPDGTGLLDEGRDVFDGTVTQPTIEGPKMYKRNGYYYIFAPAGGVPEGWQAVLRSKNIFGPYEEKVVLHQGSTNINGPHQGGWVELQSGESWFVHFQDRGAYGRIVHLQPVSWMEDWPLMGEDVDNDGIGEPVTQWKKPDVGMNYPFSAPDTSDEFDTARLGLQWQWQANPKDYWGSLYMSDSCLRLYSISGFTGDDRTLWNAPNLLLQKFPAPVFTATAKLQFEPCLQGDKAGLIITGKEYCYIALCKDNKGIRLSVIKGISEDGIRKELEVGGMYIEAGMVYLRAAVDDHAICRFNYSLDGSRYEALGAPHISREGEWIGAKVGIFCLNAEKSDSIGYTDFDWFRIEP